MLSLQALASSCCASEKDAKLPPSALVAWEKNTKETNWACWFRLRILMLKKEDARSRCAHVPSCFSCALFSVSSTHSNEMARCVHQFWSAYEDHSGIGERGRFPRWFLRTWCWETSPLNIFPKRFRPLTLGICWFDAAGMYVSHYQLGTSTSVLIICLFNFIHLGTTHHI